MKRKLFALLCIALAVIMCSPVLAGCDIFGGGDGTPKEYTVQYTDDAGLHTLKVKEGLMYSIEDVPSRTGYDFLGLFDRESGGIQYISASGTSLSAFDGDKNIILYPQWKAKEYTVVLEFQGGDVTGSRQLKASYGSALPELPANVTKEHSVFAGWYTKENCGGVLVSDKNGLVPVVSVVNESNFNLNAEYIYLYAGFSAAKYTVTLNFGSAAKSETVEAEYNTDVSELVYTARNADKQAVLSWSEYENGTDLFTGKITGDKTLYAVEWAPAIEFNTDGGEALAPVVARAGSNVSLPAPEKNLAKFLHWEDANGNEYTANTMPSGSITLKAVWQAKLVFDENGGSEVNDISLSAGTKVSLPAPEKDGYIFAGWYTADKEKYTSSTMPSAGVALKAGWYKAVMDSRVDKVGSTTGYVVDSDISTPTTKYYWYKIALNQYIGSLSEITVKIDGQFKFSYSLSGRDTTRLYSNIYSKNMASNEYLLWTKDYGSVGINQKTFNFTASLVASDDIYISFYVNTNRSYATYLRDFYFTVTYPDTATLYL